jgi:hypothetical protein
LILYAVGRTPWTGDQPVARPLPTQITTQRTQSSMPRVGFGPKIPAFEREKTVHVLDRAATVIGTIDTNIEINVWRKEVRETKDRGSK